MDTIGQDLRFAVRSLRRASGFALAALLYEVRASDPLILGAAAIVVSGLALAATIIPAYRAARIERHACFVPTRDSIIDPINQSHSRTCHGLVASRAQALR